MTIDSGNIRLIRILAVVLKFCVNFPLIYVCLCHACAYTGRVPLRYVYKLSNENFRFLQRDARSASTVLLLYVVRPSVCLSVMLMYRGLDLFEINYKNN